MTDFIGQTSYPCPSNTCWGGVSLADDMVRRLLLAAWPNGNFVQSSSRLAKTDASPPVATGNFSVVPIPQGTSVNGTHMLFTFICQNCIDSKLGFAASDTNSAVFEMGWALADTAVSAPADPAAELTFHNKGFDSFDAQLSLARSASFGEWAALAGVHSNGSTTPVPVAPGAGSSFGDDDDYDDKDEDEDNDQISDLGIGSVSRGIAVWGGMIKIKSQ
ncbi:CBD9-like protein [Acephala macrosclerotiorum]|nr:CBD9-like protein [Acephala macrosclerotiorum]